ncbi:MAG: N-acetyltransferase family protein [Luteolibacter sp.]
MEIITCGSRHSSAILAILNEAIVTSTALYDYQPRTSEMMVAWFAAKEAGRYPVIGVEGDAGELMGFASYGSFRAWPAYKYTVEHSVYVNSKFRGRGIARVLMERLIELARGQDLHSLIGVIDAENSASIALHASLGFTRCGSIQQAGFKFGRWLDVELYQLLLPTPARPEDG